MISRRLHLGCCSVHRLGHVDLVIKGRVELSQTSTTTVHGSRELGPTSAPPHHLFWSHLCFSPGRLLRCHRHQLLHHRRRQLLQQLFKKKGPKKGKKSFTILKERDLYASSINGNLAMPIRLNVWFFKINNPSESETSFA